MEILCSLERWFARKWGGGYDSERLNFLDEVDPNLPIRFSWSYEFRPRFDKWIEEEEEEEFVPFTKESLFGHQWIFRTLNHQGPTPLTSLPGPTRSIL